MMKRTCFGPVFRRHMVAPDERRALTGNEAVSSPFDRRYGRSRPPRLRFPAAILSASTHVGGSTGAAGSSLQTLRAGFGGPSQERQMTERDVRVGLPSDSRQAWLLIARSIMSGRRTPACKGANRKGSPPDPRAEASADEGQLDLALCPVHCTDHPLVGGRLGGGSQARGTGTTSRPRPVEWAPFLVHLH